MKILVIQTAFIGDVVLTTPFIREIKKKYPEAEIHFVATSDGCKILEGQSKFFCYSICKKKGFLKSTSEILEKLSAVGVFDLVFNVHSSFRSLWIGKRVKAKRYIAFRNLASLLLGFETVTYPQYNDTTHYSEKPFALFEPLNLPKHSSVGRPELFYSIEALSAIKETFEKNGFDFATPFIVLSPFSNWFTKSWPLEKYSELAQRIEKNMNASIVFSGSCNPSEIAKAKEAEEKLKQKNVKILNLVGETDLQELKALIAHAHLLVSNDSAAVHIAAAFNTPTVAIFGPTVKNWGFFPKSDRSKVVEVPNLQCRPCSLHGPNKCPLGHFRCMNEISVDDVFIAVKANRRL